MSDLQHKLSVLPNEPGVYQFFDAKGTVIYVGKAKDLRKRVSSYFTSRANENIKLRVMVSKIADIRHIVTPSESDALLLENTLIKKLMPRYNVMLKDDKSYPWICIKNEPFPRVFSTRRRDDEASKYFGPYTSSSTVRTVLELVRRMYSLRTCSLSLTSKNIERGRYKVCLEFHIGNCKAPCTGLQSAGDYDDAIQQVTDIIKGNAGSILKVLKARMNTAAAELRFEEAQIIKEKLTLLENYQAKSIVVNPAIDNVDVFSLIFDGNLAYANFLRVVKGSIVQSQTLEIKMSIEEEPSELLSLIITEMSERLHGLSHEILVPFEPYQELGSKLYTVPKRGDKLKLMQMSEKNAKSYRLERLQQLEKLDPSKHTERLLEAIQRDLHLAELPRLMECFDNSNILGNDPVAACVVFRDGKPSKKEYKHFNVKTVQGPDDFASMEEIIYRRYRRSLDEGRELPQLIIVDGGKGQLSAAVRSLVKLELYGKIPVLGLAKRLEEIYFPEDSVPLLLSKSSETLRTLMHIRDEAHRFGITFHRTKRSSKLIGSQLRDIDGVGEKTVLKLMSVFKTLSRIREADEDALAEAVGKRAAKLVRDWFANEERYEINDENEDTMKKIVIAIDGHSSTGKSTVAKSLAARLGYVYVDTGAMYRALTLHCIRQKWIDDSRTLNLERLLEELPSVRIELRATNEGTETVLNGESVENEIRSIEVSNKVSRISSVPEVRDAMVKMQQEMGRNKGVVMDGRDIGTVVFPDAELKVFMTADPQVRAMRRYRELESKGEHTSFEDVLRNIEERDFTDTNRAVSPLRKADDAIILDNSNLSPDEQLTFLLEAVGRLDL